MFIYYPNNTHRIPNVRPSLNSGALIFGRTFELDYEGAYRNLLYSVSEMWLDTSFWVGSSLINGMLNFKQHAQLSYSSYILGKLRSLLSSHKQISVFFCSSFQSTAKFLAFTILSGRFSLCCIAYAIHFLQL